MASVEKKTVAKQAHDCQGKRDVGGSGDCPTLHGVAAHVDSQVNEGGAAHAAQRRHHGQDRLLGLGEGTHGHLILEFAAHQQEKEGHEQVVYNLLEGEAHKGLAHVEAQRRLHGMVEGLVEAHIGKDESHNCSGNHHKRRYGARKSAHEADVLLGTLGAHVDEDVSATCHTRSLSVDILFTKTPRVRTQRTRGADVSRPYGGHYADIFPVRIPANRRS